MTDLPPALDIYRAANVLVQQHGAEDAALMAAMRIDALLALGDVDGRLVWQGVLRAVRELARTDRKADERIN
jgi:hypothetical protein